MGSSVTRRRENGKRRKSSLVPFLMLCGLTSATAFTSASTNVFTSEESSVSISYLSVSLVEMLITASERFLNLCTQIASL